ncbi:SCP-like protein [Ancylostoma ceylanicum]|uniref:SCP-like protein n=1 Tax=Ancylostoma ceylanicum TaxID=53326 RepID=A0A0D6L6I5_9BILA|nr:SCP-like protein [Ancylostoma ceylanicum]
MMLGYVRHYQCWNFGQTNDIRHIYLTGVNKLREAIPKGEAPNKGGSKCPKGKNIYKLNWDCILESYAQETVDKCEEKPTLDSKLSSELSIVWNKTTLTTCNPTPLLKEQAKHWWSEVETVGLSTDAAFAKGLENFAVLANGLATRIGCAQKNCNGDLHMACLVYGNSYSCALEAEAYATAKQCLTTDPDVENENWFIATAANKKEAATKAMEAWYNEITTSYMVQATGSQNLLTPSLNIRHFARIVWDLNTQVGCAVHKCGNKFHAVCRYGKGVGVYGSPIYFMGPRACNQCLDKCVDGALCPP